MSSILLGIMLVMGCSGPRTNAIRKASHAYGIPEDVLMAHGWLMSRLEDTQFDTRDTSTAEERFGIMRLTTAQVAQGAKLAGLSVEQVRTEREANVMAAAALMRTYLDELGQESQAPKYMQYFNVGPKIAELPDFSDDYAQDLRRLLARGLDITTMDGERLSFDPVEELIEDLTEDEPVTPGKYPPLRRFRKELPGHTFKEGRDNKPIIYIVIHMAEGSYWGTIADFQSGVETKSAHYVVSESGQITRLVREEDAAYHAGNWFYNLRSIGIEHEGFTGDPQLWNYKAMYRASASLVCAIVKNKKHSILSSKENGMYLIGHVQVPDPDFPPAARLPATMEDLEEDLTRWGGKRNHVDPGTTWNWPYYMEVVRDCLRDAEEQGSH